MPGPLPRPPAAVVFDMDGLLFDTERLYERAILAAAADIGCEMSPEIFRQIIGTPWIENKRRLLAHYGEDFPAEQLRIVWMQHFDRLVVVALDLKPGVMELLALLDELRLPRAIATSSSPQTVKHHLTSHGLEGRFQAIVAQGDYQRSKPAPDPFLVAAERLGIAPAFCLALEDSHNGVRSASAAGMMTIMVPDLLPANDEMTSLCSHVADDLHQVRRLIAGAGAPCIVASTD